MHRRRFVLGGVAVGVLSSFVIRVAGAPDAAFMGRGMPYAAFDALAADVLQVDRGTIRVAIAPGNLGQSKAKVLSWVKGCAQTIAAYYGRFPVDELELLVVPVSGREIHGTTWGYRGAAIRILLGRDAAEADMLDSWVLPHEFVHLALPSLDEDQRWLEEGTATYVEAIARVRAGRGDERQLWRELMRDMPKGQPRAGDQGLDRTHTWARTYWGGALYCLFADVTIRERSGNRHGLQDALSAIVAAGGTVTQEWPVSEVLAIGDHATGTSVLQELYAATKSSPMQFALDALWARLGVSSREGRIVLDESAPLAHVRRSIVGRSDAGKPEGA